MLMVLLMLPLSSAMDNGEFNHGGGSGSSGRLVAAAAVAGVAVDNDWQQKRPTMKALMVA
jgi:hypothetical protein